MKNIFKLYRHYLWKKREKKGHTRYHCEPILFQMTPDNGISVQVTIPNGYILDKSRVKLYPEAGSKEELNTPVFLPMGSSDSTKNCSSFTLSFSYKVTDAPGKYFEERFQVIKEGKS